MNKLFSGILTLLFVLISTVTVLACNAPGSIFTDNTDAGRAWLRWTTVPTAVQYRVSFRPVGNPTWTTVNVSAPDTLRTLTNLNPGTAYEYRIRTLCPNNVLSNWSNTQFFTTLSCEMPVGFAVGTITETTAALSWNAAVNATGYRLRFRPIGNTNWSNVNNITLTNHTLTGLDPGTNYEVEIRTDCNTANSGWGNNQPFTTVACVLPTNFSVAAVTPTTAELTWDAVGNATSYRLRYRIIGANNWTTRNNITVTSLIINNLQPNSNYEIQIRTVCGQGLSDWSTSQNFSTLACLTPATAQADSVTPTRAWLSWASVPNAQAYRLQYRRVGDPTWIQVNNIPNTLRTLTNLLGGTTYEFQVSTKCGNNRYSDWSASATFTTGPCDTPANIFTNNIEATEARINWSSVPHAIRYEIRYRPVGSQTWNYVSTTQLIRNLTGLTGGTTYEYQVRSKCGNIVFSDWSNLGTFTTYDCVSPTSVGVSYPQDTVVQLNWSRMNNANQYTIRFKVEGDSVWTTRNTTDTTLIINGLRPNTAYVFQIRTRCTGNIYAAWSSVNTWHTGPCFTPTGLMVSTFSDSSLTVVWNAVPDAGEYIVIYQSVEDSSWRMLRTTHTQLTIMGLNPNQIYKIAVASNCISGYSPYSPPILGFIPDALYQITDRFGRLIRFQDILIPETGGGGTGALIVINNNDYKCLAYEPNGHPKFNLHFEDVRLNTDQDFDDPTPTSVIVNGVSTSMSLGAARRRVVCKVFEDLSKLLTARRGTPVVNIRINANGQTNNPLTGGELGTASPFFFDPNLNVNPPVPQGLTESAVARKINADTSTIGCIYTGRLFDGEMTYNFNAFTGQGRFPYWVDFDNTVIPPTGNEVDMYSVVLHEAMHLLGIASLIQGTDGRGGRAMNGYCGYYTPFDLHLYNGATGNSKVITRNLNYDWCATPINPPSINGLCSTSTTLYFGGPAVDANGRLHVYTNDGSGFNPGSSWSHFYNGGTCTGSCTYNMCYSYGGDALSTIKRHPTADEVRVLCDLGYKISGQYGYNETCIYPAPIQVAYLDINRTSVRLNWQPVNDAVQYVIQYRQRGNPTWTTVTTSNLTLDISGLIKDTVYYFQRRTQCSGNMFSVWSPIQEFNNQTYDDGINNAPDNFGYNGIRNRRYQTYRPCEQCYVGGGNDCGRTTSTRTALDATINDYTSQGFTQIKPGSPEIVFISPYRLVSQFTVNILFNRYIEVTRPADFEGCVVVRYIPQNSGCEGVQTYQEFCFSNPTVPCPLPPPVLFCQIPENSCPELICDGSFESFDRLKLYQHANFNINLGNSPELFERQNGQMPNYNFLGQKCPKDSILVDSTLALPNPYDGNKYIFLGNYAANGRFVNTEAITIELLKPLEKNGNYILSAYARTNLCDTTFLNFTFSKTRPCSPGCPIADTSKSVGNMVSNTNKLRIRNCGDYFFKPGHHCSKMVPNNSIWNRIECEICIEDTVDFGAKYITIYPDWQKPFKYRWVLLDAVSLRAVQPDANILPVNPESCLDSVTLNLDRDLGCHYKYSWSPSAGLSCHPNCDSLSNPRVKAKPGGRQQYSLTIWNTSDCFTTRTIIVADSSPFVTSRAENPIACSGTSTIKTTVTEGQPNYTYSWSPSTYLSNPNIAEPVFTYTPPFNDETLVYTLTVTDANGCTATDTVVIQVFKETMPPPVLSSTSPAYCGGNPVTLTATVSNPNNYPVTYRWQPCLVGCDQLTLNVTPNTTTVYTFTATFAGGNCSVSNTIQIGTGLPIRILKPSVNPVRCFGGNDGQISFTAAGGTGSFTYRWWDGNQPLSSLRTGLRAGTYGVTVVDASGCRKDTTFIVTQPSQLNAALDQFINPQCEARGSISTTVTGGTSPYTYAWTRDGVVLPFTTDDLTNLSQGGNYRLIVTDFNGCKDTLDQTLANGTTVIEPTVEITDVICTLGKIKITLQGAVLPINYVLTGPVNQTANNINSNTFTFDNLPAGLYTLQVTDATGCRITVTPRVRQIGTPLTVSTFIQNAPACWNSAQINVGVTVSPSGSYRFNWSDGTTTFSTAGSMGSQLTGVTPGIYCVTITDLIRGCAEDTCITAPARPTYAYTTGVVPETCPGFNDGKIIVNLDRVPGGIMTVSAQEQPNGNVFSTQQSSQQITLNSINPGTYRLTVYDEYGCQQPVIAQVIVPASFNEPQINSTQLVHPSCFGSSDGAIRLTFPLGTPPLTYEWRRQFDVVVLSTNRDLENVQSGTYCLSVRYGGCQKTFTCMTLTDPSALMTANDSIVYAQCLNSADGLIKIRTQGGTAPYTFRWYPLLLNNQRGQQLFTETNANGISTLSGISVGTYEVDIIDDNGCVLTKRYGVGMANPNVSVKLYIGSSPIKTATVCQGDPLNLYLKHSPTQGITLTYYWNQISVSNNCDTLSNTCAINTPVAGTFTYRLMVKDSYGCVRQSDSVIVTVLPKPDVRITYTCSGGSYILSADISNNDVTFFRWYPTNLCSPNCDRRQITVTPGQTTTYSAITQIANGCTAMNTVVLPPTRTGTATVLSSATTVCSGKPVVLIGRYIGGWDFGPLQYRWVTNKPTSVCGGSCSTGRVSVLTDSAIVSVRDTITYTLFVIDSTSRCTLATAQKQIVFLPRPVITGVTLTSDPAACATILKVQGNATYYTYVILPSGIPGTRDLGEPDRSAILIPNSGAGRTIWIRAYNAFGCVAETTIVFNPPDLLRVSIQPDPAYNCAQTIIRPTQLNTTVTGSLGILTYQWSRLGLNGACGCTQQQLIRNQLSPTPCSCNGASVWVSNNNEENYVVRVQDSRGCVAYDTLKVTTRTIPTNVTASASPDSICKGDSVRLTAQGTNANYFRWLPDNVLTDINGKYVNDPQRDYFVRPLQTTTYTVIGYNQINPEVCGSTQATVTVYVVPTDDALQIKDLTTGQLITDTIRFCGNVFRQFAIVDPDKNTLYNWAFDQLFVFQCERPLNSPLPYNCDTIYTHVGEPLTDIGTIIVQGYKGGNEPTCSRRVLHYRIESFGYSFIPHPNQPPMWGDRGTNCLGNTFTLQAQSVEMFGQILNIPLTWKLYKDGSLIQTSTIPPVNGISTFDFTPTSQGVYEVEITGTNQGCDYTNRQTFRFQTPQITATASQSTVCEGAAVTLTGRLTDPLIRYNVNGDRLEWVMPGGSIIDAYTNPVLNVNPTQGANTYILRHYDPNYPCHPVVAETLTVNITDAANPFTVTGDRYVCAGQSSSIGMSNTNGYDQIIFRNIGTGTTNSNPTFPLLLGVGDYEICAYAGTCVSCQSFSIRPFVGPATIFVNPSNLTLCTGSSVTLTATGNHPNATIKWTEQGQFFPFAFGNTATVSSNTATSKTYIVSAVNEISVNCYAPVSTTVTVTWVDQPAPFTPHYSSSVCVNGTIALGAENPPAYLTWTDLGTNTVVATGNNATVPAGNAGQRNFRVCGSNEPSMNCAVCYNFSVNVTNNPTLIEHMLYMDNLNERVYPSYVETNGSSVTVCRTQTPFIEGPQYVATISLYAQEPGGYIARQQGMFNIYYPVYRYTYLWNTGETTPILTATITQTTTYTLTVTDPAGCQEVKIFTVKVPTATLAPNGCDLINQPGNALITIRVTDGTPPHRYFVDGIEDQSSPAPTNNVPFAVSLGSPAVLRIVTAEGCELIFNYSGNDCDVTPQFRKEKQPEIVTTENHIKLYPNPANDRVSLSYRFGGLEAVAQVSICDVQGKEVFRQSLKGTKGETDIATAQWSSGVYICKILDGNRQISVQKLVITR